VFADEFSAFSGVGVSLDASQFGIVFAQLDGFDAESRKEVGDICASFGNQVIGKEITIAVDNCKLWRAGYWTAHFLDGKRFRLEKSSDITAGYFRDSKVRDEVDDLFLTFSQLASED
jgi:hypothetical protein